MSKGGSAGASAGGKGAGKAGAGGEPTGPADAFFKGFEGTSDRYLVASAPYPGGGVAILGFFDGTVDLGGGPLSSQGALTATEPEWAIFVAKLGAGGEHVWSKRYGGPGVARPQAIAVNENGGVILAGGFTGTLSFGETTLTSAGGTDVFVAALDGEGSPRWAVRYGDVGNQIANAVAVDRNGDVLFAGALAGAADFGGGALASKGDDDVFAVRLDEKGKHQWSKIFGDGAAQRAFGIAVDVAGSVVLTGTFAGGADFGGGALPNRGGRDLFLVKLSGKGEHQLSRSFGGVSDQIARSVAVSKQGRIALVGEFAEALDFGPPSGDYALAVVAPPLPGGAGGQAGAGGADGKAGAAGAVGGQTQAGGAGGTPGGGSGGAGGAPILGAGACSGPGLFFHAPTTHCYHHVAGGKTWEDARVFCEAEGKGWSLVALNGPDETTLVQATFAFESAWSGGNDITKEGAFEWDGGEPFTLPAGEASWNAGEPNNGGGAENCLEILKTGKLNDRACKEVLGFVCERASLYPALKSHGGTDAFVVVFDPKGGKLWDASFGDVGDQRAWSVAFDDKGGVLVAGDAPGTLDLGSGDLPPGHVFAASFGPKGAPVWSRRHGPGVGQALTATVSQGSAFVGGVFSGTLGGAGATISAGDRLGAFLFARPM